MSQVTVQVRVLLIWTRVWTRVHIEYDSKRDMGTSVYDIESQVTTAHYLDGSQDDNWMTVEGKKNRLKT